MRGKWHASSRSSKTRSTGKRDALPRGSFLHVRRPFLRRIPEMIRFLDEQLNETLVISLDNDLELKPGPDGRMIDPGSGAGSRRILAGKACRMPGDHSHDEQPSRGRDARRASRGADWRTHRVVPFDDMKWIESDWFFAIRRAIVGPIKRKRQRESLVIFRQPSRSLPMFTRRTLAEVHRVRFRLPGLRGAGARAGRRAAANEPTRSRRRSRTSPRRPSA